MTAGYFDMLSSPAYPNAQQPCASKCTAALRIPGSLSEVEGFAYTRIAQAIPGAKVRAGNGI